MIQISEELLSKVLGYEVFDIEVDEEIEYKFLSDIKSDGNGILYEVYENDHINIYEFTHIAIPQYVEINENSAIENIEKVQTLDNQLVGVSIECNLMKG